MEDEVLDRLKDAYVNCPDCEDQYGDDQYTCTTCWCEGGQGTINVFRYLKEYPTLLGKVDN